MGGLLHREESASPFLPRFAPSSTCLHPVKTVVSSYVLRIFSVSIDREFIRRTYEETTVRARPGQGGDVGAGAVGEKDAERGTGKMYVRISD